MESEKKVFPDFSLAHQGVSRTVLQLEINLLENAIKLFPKRAEQLGAALVAKKELLMGFDADDFLNQPVTEDDDKWRKLFDADGNLKFYSLRYHGISLNVRIDDNSRFIEVERGLNPNRDDLEYVLGIKQDLALEDISNLLTSSEV